MTTTFTKTTTFTVTHARYLASKIASDLRQMKLFYCSPNDQQIDDYLAEAMTFLLGGYLESVSYGFRCAGEWVVALKYTAHTNGLITSDNPSGGVKPGIDISNASWYTFLTYSSAFQNLQPAEKEKVTAGLRIQRTDGVEPKATGVWTADKSYSNGGVGLQRRLFTK
jgi:hypothetical protein